MCGADQFLENSACVAKKAAGEYCWDNYYYGPGYGPGGEEETKRENPMCASGKCGGSSSDNYMMSMSPYCCADPTCEKPCDQGTGACTTKSMPGEACSSKDDCYGEHACMGGKCCSFTHSEWQSSSDSNDPYSYMYSYNNERISKCTACGGTGEKDQHGSDRPGQCVSCAAGYRLLTGKETDVNNGWESGVCGPTCNSTSYLDAGMWPMQCVTKTDAGKYCYNRWPYYDPMIDSEPDSHPPSAFNTGGFMCKSGLCGGGGADSMSMSWSTCSYDPMSGYSGDQHYCCNDAAKAAGCTKPCDKTTGDCTTKAMPGETCTSSADCFNDRACVGDRCCAFAACDHNPQSPPPPSPGSYDPYGGMYGMHEDSQRYRYKWCNQCGDTKAKDHNGIRRPGMCMSCGGDERLLIGDPKEESTYWDAGVCAPKCAEGEYFEGGMFKCTAKNKDGEYCWSHYQWDPITGEATDIGGVMCKAGVCGSTVKDPFAQGHMMGNEYCCNADAVKEVDGQCCGRCKQGSGECLEWETCPAPPSEDMSTAQAAAAGIIGSIKDEKHKIKAEKLTVAAMAGEDIHKLAGKLKESSGDAAIKTFYRKASIDEKHGAAVATSLDAGWNQFLNPGGRRRLLAEYEFEVEVFFTETEVKANSISLRTASTNLETAGVNGVTMQEDVDPIKELKAMGVDSEQLEDFETKAKKSSAEVQSKRAIAPLPPSPPPAPNLILDDEDAAPGLGSGAMFASACALLSVAVLI